jgi:hypothetical protein
MTFPSFHLTALPHPSHPLHTLHFTSLHFFAIYERGTKVSIHKPKSPSNITANTQELFRYENIS